MNIILDNIIYSKENQGGISNYWYELTQRFQTYPNLRISYCDEPNANNNLYRNLLSINPDQLLKSDYRSILSARLGSVKYKSDETFLYHSSFYRPINTNIEHKEITTVHDFTHDFFSPLHKKILHNRLKYNAIKRSSGIICVSKNTYKDLKKFCTLKPNQKVEIIYNGVSDDYQKLNNKKESIDYLNHLNLNSNEYIIYVGSRAPYKNFDFAIELLSEISENIKLVVVGGNFNTYETKLLIKKAKNRVERVSGIPNYKLNFLYNHALALIYPSSYEGFGIPIIESMKAGCPVLALNKSSIPEISGDAALLADELNLSDFKKKIMSLESRSYRNEIIEKGLIQSSKFSWDKTARMTYDFYKEIFQ